MLIKVSIVVPVYNNEKYLNRSIECILNQTCSDIEIILVNNGSSDGSLEICREYAVKDSRVVLIDIPENVGAGAARNSGIDAARGEYIVFLDADDWYEPTLVKGLLSAVSKIDADVGICGYETYVEGADDKSETVSLEAETFASQRELRSFFANTFPHGITGFLWNKIYKTSVIKGNGVEFPTTERLEDGFFNLEFFSVAKSGVLIPDVLYHYRVSDSVEVVKKHSKEYHSLVESLVARTIEDTTGWKDVTDLSYAELYRFYLNEIGTCTENAFVGDWGFSSAARKEYLDSLMNASIYSKAYKRLGLIGAYRQVLHRLLKARKYVLLGFIVRTKTFVKKNFKKIYYLLKK